MRYRSTLALIVVTFGLQASGFGLQRAAAQATPAVANTGRLAFEVASIKPNDSGSTGGGAGLRPGGLYTVTNLPALSLIAIAYQTDRPLLHFQIVGGPAWMDTSRFDMTARATSDQRTVSQQELNAMLRTLLEDRFQLKTHRETRQEQIYELVKARADGRLGPGLRASDVDCLALAKQRRDDPSAATPWPAACSAGVKFGAGIVSGGSVQISNLVASLSGAVERLVVDHTGLTGNFDIDLHWTPGTPAGVSAGTTSGDDVVSVFTAVQEQLGLKLESTRGPVEVLVIDRIEPPTPN